MPLLNMVAVNIASSVHLIKMHIYMMPQINTCCMSWYTIGDNSNPKHNITKSMVGPWPLALHHDYLQCIYISCIFNASGSKPGCYKDFPDWWNFWYATSLIVPVFMRFQLSWLDSSICQTFPSIMEILIHYISSAIMEIMGPLYIFIMDILIYVYCTWRWPLMWYLVLCLFMSIVLLCIRDCYIYYSWFYHSR